jgi:hypothetical protein
VAANRKAYGHSPSDAPDITQAQKLARGAGLSVNKALLRINQAITKTQERAVEISIDIYRGISQGWSR